ncbi:hypothetical protein [Longispora albida]|uniref:hypothetical protein n=1 Tax=Longispora albida TaxID=203523 RepID=UPI000378CA38|nr:hypothetical protein [Longispora albida]
MIRWEYARLEYRATGNFGGDRDQDWRAVFVHSRGAENWGTDERFNDIPHLNKAGAAGWEAYDRSPRMIGQPLRLQVVTYSMRRPVE